MSKRGNEILRSYEVRIRAEKDHQTISQGCLWCKERFVGELCDARDWFTLHLLSDHPDRVVVKRRLRKHSSRFRTMGTRPLEENIANARTQGASTWVNEE